MVVIWPENSIGHRPADQPPTPVEIAPAAKCGHAPILVGAVHRRAGAAARDNPVATNSVIRWDGGTGPGDRHDKQIVAAVRRVPAVAQLLRALCRRTPIGPATSCPGTRQRGGQRGRACPSGSPTCWEVHLRPRRRESVTQRCPAARGARQQRHLHRGDEPRSSWRSPAARRRARSLHGGRGYDWDQRDHRPRRAPAGPHRVLRTRLPRYPGPAEDRLTPATRWASVVEDTDRGAIGVASDRRRDAAQWEFRAAPGEDAATGESRR